MSGIHKTPDEWSALKGIHVMDPDGWRCDGAPDWDQPISSSEFDKRAGMSTVAPTREPCTTCGHSRATLWFGLTDGEHSEDDGSCISCGPELGRRCAWDES